MLETLSPRSPNTGGDRRGLWSIVTHPVLQRAPIPAQVPPTFQPEALGFLKLQSIILLLALLIIAGIVANSYLHPTPDAIRQAQMQHSLERMQLWHNIGQIALPSAVGLLLLALAGGVRWVWRFSGRPTLIHSEDGLYPVAVWDRSTLRDRLAGKRRVLAHNPNTAIASTLSITAEPDGQITAASDTPDSRHADQIAVVQSALSVQRTLAAASALKAPRESVAQIKERHGYYDNPPRPKEAQVIPPLALPALAPAQSVLTLADAMKPAIVGDIIFGQEPDGARGLAVYRPADDYHISLLGSSGFGKSTNAAWAILLGFLRMGGIATVAEPEGAAQFAEVQPWAEWARLDGAGLTRHAETIHREFQRRGDEMTRRGAGHFSDIPANERPPHLLAIFEEYTKARTQAQRAGTLADFDAIMGEIAQDAGKTGIHLLLIAQNFHPTDGQPWPVTVRDNCGFRISYNQPGNDITKTLGGVYKLSALEKGQFAHRGKIYNGYHARPEFARILANVPHRSGPGILDGGGASGGRSVVRSVDNSPAPTGVQPYRTATESDTESTTERPALVGDEARQAIHAHLEKSPNATQADIRAALGTSNGWTHQCWHEWHKAQKLQSPTPSAKPEPEWVGGKEFLDLSQTDIFGHNLTVLDTANPADAAELERIRAEIARGNFDIRSSK